MRGAVPASAPMISGADVPMLTQMIAFSFTSLCMYMQTKPPPARIIRIVAIQYFRHGSACEGLARSLYQARSSTRTPPKTPHQKPLRVVIASLETTSVPRRALAIFPDGPSACRAVCRLRCPERSAETDQDANRECAGPAPVRARSGAQFHQLYGNPIVRPPRLR